MNTINRRNDKTNILYYKALAFVFPFLIGGYHAFSSATLTVVLLVCLVLIILQKRKLYFYKNDAFVAVSLLLIGYVLSIIWAVDRGMAVFGVVHFLPLLPLSLLLMQSTQEQKEEIMSVIPWSGALMTVVSEVLRYVPAFKGFFTVSGRLAGFYQYPNTFALFLLVGLIIISFSESALWKKASAGVVLLGGIFLSGSRVIFALTVLVVIVLLVIQKDKKMNIFLGSILGIGIVVAILYTWKTQDLNSIGRFLTISLSESTLLGRLLYYKDAMPVILKHPFGMGYMGYYFTHHSFQTGVYQLMFVHNDFLQLLLDIGWIPTVFMAVVVIETIVSRTVSIQQKMVLSVIVLHSLLDFDLQFLSILCILMLCLEFSKGKSKTRFVKKELAFAVCAVGILFSSYLGVAQFMQFIHKSETATALFPAYTVAKMEMLSNCEDLQTADVLADRILQTNKNVTQANRVKAGYAYSQGDITQFIEYGMTALRNEPYEISEYEKFGNQIMAVIPQYESMGDTESVEACKEALSDMWLMLKETERKTSDLAWRIDERPCFELSDNLTDYIYTIQK